VTGLSQSAIYIGRVRHRRLDTVRHAFSVRLYMLYIDLDELPQLLSKRWWCSARRWAPLRFCREDYLGPPALPLADAVREEVNRALGCEVTGPVRMLTNLRCFGYIQNPVTFYFCHDANGRLAGVLAEITNTPWGERHHYVLGADAAGRLRGRFEKAFHVSPFQPMAQQYRWAFSPPGRRLAVHMKNLQHGKVVFDATLGLQRAPLTSRNLLRVLLRHPWMTAKVVLGIYWQALLLWCKRAPFHSHPRKQIAS
jgi:DUF1365 family protein